MKTMKHIIATLLGMALLGATAAHAAPSAAPEMNGKLRVTTLAPENIRYTGKPYSKALGAYVFNAREDDPQMSRWTTADPSGFPDGANNKKYAPVPTTSVDTNGLWTIKLCAASSGSSSWSDSSGQLSATAQLTSETPAGMTSDVITVDATASAHV